MRKCQNIVYYLLPFLLLMFWTGSGPVRAAEAIHIIVDGSVVQTDVPPYIDGNDRTIVPVRFISEELGCEVDWNQGKKMATASRQGTTVEIYIDKNTAFVDGKEVVLDTTAVLEEGRTMVPLRFLAETFNFEVTWLGEERIVLIESQASPPEEPEAKEPENEEPETKQPDAKETETKEKRLAVINGNNVNIRSGPGTNYDSLTKVFKGLNLIVLNENNGWLQIEMSDGRRGWVADYLVDFPNASAGTPVELISSGDTGMGEGYMPSGLNRSALVMKSSLNIRSGPGEQYSVVSKANCGQQLPILREENDWLAVRLPDGATGWIAGWLVAVRYDGNKQESVAGGSQTANLVSRWSAVETERYGELPTISGLLVEQSGSKVVLRINAESPLELPASFQLDNPSRLVFDFTACLGENEETPLIGVHQGAVSSFRLGRLDERTVRVVADLQAPASYALEQSSDGKTVTFQIQTLDTVNKIIVIDPGHGSLSQWDSIDPGAIGPSGVKERDVNQSISKLLGNILLNEGYTVIYTNEEKTALSLEERALVASLSGAELLVSIHANASTNPSLSGTMTFYYNPATLEKGARVQQSKTLAGYIQEELLNRLQREDKGVQDANFAVLRNCPITAALVEVAFLSNPTEEKLLVDPAFQRRAAEAIALGIKRYLVTQQVL
jgi:N-acetylmuramoyl-L-alanine amidase